ncbi:MAG: TRAP transporter substrate-binding protein [Burkholderiales bacterium]
MNAMRIGAKSIAAILLGIFVAPAVDAQTVNLRLISGWTPNNPNVPLIETVMIKNIADASNGEIKIQRSGPEVVPPFEQLQPVSAGVFDILFTTPGYHQAQTGVANVFDTMKPDPEKRREGGVTAWADDYYNKRYGMRILSLIPAPGNHFVLRESLGADLSLKGRKIRAIATFEGAVRALGGTPVNMGPADAFAAMQKGVIDGITFPAFASADYKLFEVGKFMTRPIFGGTNVLTMINTKKFDSLSPAHQKIILDEGRKLEVTAAKALMDHERKDIDTMVKNGVAISNFDAKTGANLNRLYNEGILATASKSTPNEVKTLYELARSKNLLNE